MKTLTTTLSIFALLLSNVAFCNNSSGEIIPPHIKNDRPPISINESFNEIIPPHIKNDRPGFNS